MSAASGHESDPVFYPASVAVIGASTDFKRLGYHCMSSLIMGRFPGKIYPIHPSLPEVSGFKAYPSVTQVPGKIDLAIVAVRTSLVPSVLYECVGKGIKGIVLITAGFKEIEDKAGAVLQDEITDASEEVAEEAVAEEEAVSEEEPVAEEVAAEDTPVDETAADEAESEEPVAEEVAAEDTPVDETATDEAESEEPVAEEVVAEDTPVDETAADEAESKEPVAEEQVAEE